MGSQIQIIISSVSGVDLSIVNDKPAVNHLSQNHPLLSAMGIEQWVARTPLAGGPKGHQVFPLSSNSVKRNKGANRLAVDMSADRDGGTQIGREKIIVSRGLAIAEVLELDSSGAKGLHRSVTPSTENATANSPPHKLTDTSATKSRVEPQPFSRFELLLTASGGVLLVDDVSEASFANSAYLHWANSVFVAMGCNPLSVHAQLQPRFRWPLENAQLFDDNTTTGLAVAKETVSAWLMRVLKQQKISKVVVMGAAPIAMLSNVDQVSDAIGRTAMLSELNGIVAVLTHGSQQLWKDTQLKSALWTHLQLLQSTVVESS